LVPDIGCDHRAVAEAELRAVAFADLYALGEPERLRQPLDRLPHVGIDQHWNDGCRRDRAVRLHTIDPTLGGWRKIASGKSIACWPTAGLWGACVSVRTGAAWPSGSRGIPPSTCRGGCSAPSC